MKKFISLLLLSFLIWLFPGWHGVQGYASNDQTLTIKILDMNGQPLDMRKANFWFWSEDRYLYGNRQRYGGNNREKNDSISIGSDSLTASIKNVKSINYTVSVQCNNYVVVISDSIENSQDGSIVEKIYKVNELCETDISMSFIDNQDGHYEYTVLRSDCNLTDEYGSTAVLDSNTSKLYISKGIYNISLKYFGTGCCALYTMTDINIQNQMKINVTPSQVNLNKYQINISESFKRYKYYKVNLLSNTLSGDISNTDSLTIYTDNPIKFSVNLSENKKDEYNGGVLFSVGSTETNLGNNFYPDTFDISGNGHVNLRFKDENGNSLRFLEITRPKNMTLEINNFLTDETLIKTDFSRYWDELFLNLDKGIYTAKIYPAELSTGFEWCTYYYLEVSDSIRFTPLYSLHINKSRVEQNVVYKDNGLTYELTLDIVNNTDRIKKCETFLQCPYELYKPMENIHLIKRNRTLFVGVDCPDLIKNKKPFTMLVYGDNFKYNLSLEYSKISYTLNVTDLKFNAGYGFYYDDCVLGLDSNENLIFKIPEPVADMIFEANEVNIKSNGYTAIVSLKLNNKLDEFELIPGEQKTLVYNFNKELMKRYSDLELSVFEDNTFLRTIPLKPLSYEDIQEHWAKDYIEKLMADDIVFGRENDRFCPDDEITRAEFAAFFSNMANKDVDVTGINFTDVPESHPLHKYVSNAVALKLISGYDDGTFRPDSPITRQDAAVIIKRYFELDPEQKNYYVDLSNYNDFNLISDYALDALQFCVSRGIINGKTGRLIAPLDNITRAETVVLIYRMLGY